MSSSVHAGIHTHPPGCGPGDPPGQTPQPPPWVWAWRLLQPDPSTSPLAVGLENPPSWPDPSTSPLGVGLETPLQTSQPSPPGCGPGDLQGMLGYHTPPPCGQDERYVKNHNLRKLRLRAVIKLQLSVYIN